MKYSNPRKEATIENWPFGFKLKTTATFTIEQNKKGEERAVRTTIDPRNGRVSAPKKLTFAEKMRIVDGDDGKTYIAYLTTYRFVGIMQSNMQYQEETIHENNDHYAEVMALFVE